MYSIDDILSRLKNAAHNVVRTSKTLAEESKEQITISCDEVNNFLQVAN